MLLLLLGFGVRLCQKVTDCDTLLKRIRYISLLIYCDYSNINSDPFI